LKRPAKPPPVDPLELNERRTPPKFDAFVRKVLAYKPPKDEKPATARDQRRKAAAAKP